MLCWKCDTETSISKKLVLFPFISLHIQNIMLVFLLCTKVSILVYWGFCAAHSNFLLNQRCKGYDLPAESGLWSLRSETNRPDPALCVTQLFNKYAVKPTINILITALQNKKSKPIFFWLFYIDSKLAQQSLEVWKYQSPQISIFVLLSSEINCREGIVIFFFFLRNCSLNALKSYTFKRM